MAIISGYVRPKSVPRGQVWPMYRRRAVICTICHCLGSTPSDVLDNVWIGLNHHLSLTPADWLITRVAVVASSPCCGVKSIYAPLRSSWQQWALDTRWSCERGSWVEERMSAYHRRAPMFAPLRPSFR